MKASRLLAAAALLLADGCGSVPTAPNPPPTPTAVAVAVSVHASAPIATVSAAFVSYTLDWWLPDEGAWPEGWGPHANVLGVDLESRKLRMLAAALAPSILRIGGSLDKDVVYADGISDEPCSPAPAPGRRGGLHRSCLNASRWDQLHDFAHATGSKIVFGLSYPQVGDDSSGAWNSSQAEALFRYSRHKGYLPSTTLFGFELGEELTKFQLGTPAFTAYTQSYHVCATLLREVFGSDGPKLMGPCPGMSWPQLATWYPAFLDSTDGALDVAVYHSYNQIHPDPPRVLYLNETVPSGSLDKQHGTSPGGTGWQAKAMATWSKEAGLPVWLGEFGPHNGGGGGTYSSTFVSSFGYVDTLGTLARMGHAVLARQTLVGGNYELLRCSSGGSKGPEGEAGAGCDFEPHPDYWVALLWRELMGTEVLPAPDLALAPSATQNQSGLGALRVHAHCTAKAMNGSVTLAFSNMADVGTATYALNVVSSSSLPSPLISLLSSGSVDVSLDVGRRVEYHLAAASRTEGMGACGLALNGEPLEVGGGANARVPAVRSMGVERRQRTDGPIKLGPVSIAWVVLPDAGAVGCMGQGKQNLQSRLKR